MRWILIIIVCSFASACGAAPQPKSAETVAAFEVPLASQAERELFVSILRDTAKDYGMHVDTATQEELERKARVHPNFKMTISAAVWKGQNDDESIASVMDQPDHLGRAWISFSRGEDPVLNSRFREATMMAVMRNWPETLSLPIMPTGATPLHRDLLKKPKGYVVDPKEAYKYTPEAERPR